MDVAENGAQIGTWTPKPFIQLPRLEPVGGPLLLGLRPPGNTALRLISFHLGPLPPPWAKWDSSFLLLFLKGV